MAAIIRSLRNGLDPIQGASRNDLRAGDVVTLQSVDVATTYAWTIAYKPEGSTAVFSGDVTQQSPGSFTVDKEGPYLIRLTVNLGLPTENSQFVRLRFLTILGDLKLVAAGEQIGGAVPIPVDATPQGWANEQNFNLLTLLDLIDPVVASGRILYVDANDGTEGYGDFDTVQAAIDYAVAQGAGALTPWVVQVRPGLYVEDVTFAPYVHVLGWPGPRGDTRVVRIQAATGTHTVPLPAGGDQLIIAFLTLVNIDGAATGGTVTVTGTGRLDANDCFLVQEGVSAAVGPALDVQGGTVVLNECQVQATSGAFTDRFAVVVQGGVLVADRGLILGTSGLRADEGTHVELSDIRVVSTGPVGSLGVSSVAQELWIKYSSIEASGGDPLKVNPLAAAIASPVGLTIRWSHIKDGDVYFDTTGIAGATSLILGSCEYDALDFPGGSPASFQATVKAKSLFYDNTTSGMVAEDVQDAIDEAYAAAISVLNLDQAYDGGVGAGGSGRRIIADAGAVEIVDAVAPSDPPDPANPNGRLRVNAGIEIGAITRPELDLDPNPYGNGPMLRMGQAVWADNAPHGSTAYVVARSTGTPLYRNYNLRLQTESTDGGTQTGWVVVRAGDGYATGVSPVEGSPVVLQAGSAFHAGGGDGGNVYLAPGESVAGTQGAVIYVDPATGSGATLTAAGAFVGGVTGTIRFATDMGGIEVAIDAADNLATVLAKFNATNEVLAIDSGGGVIQLTTTSEGPTAEIFYLNETVLGLDVALGTFDGQVQVDGSWTSFITFDVTAPNEITIGLGGATGPLIYNADTGKLTVPGLIDPTGMIFTEAGGPGTGAGKGALFVSDGSSGLIANDLYYRDAAGLYYNLLGGIVTASIAIQDEGISVDPNTTTLNFVGAGVTATSVGPGLVDVTIPGGGAGSVKVEQEVVPGASFVWGGVVSTFTLSQTPDTTATLAGLYLLFRNGVADMTNVTPAVPASGAQYRINGTALEIGADVTASGNTYRLMYPRI